MRGQCDEVLHKCRFFFYQAEDEGKCYTRVKYVTILPSHLGKGRFMIYFATSEPSVQLTAQHGKWQEQKTFTGKNGKLMTQLAILTAQFSYAVATKQTRSDQSAPPIHLHHDNVHYGEEILPTLHVHTGKYSYRITKYIIKYYCHMT